MISFDEALNIVLNHAPLMATENIEFSKSMSRILAQDVFSDINMPPFNKSAMDGFACRQADIGNKLEIIEVIKAGETPKNRIDVNQCAKIMTGAPIPFGADCVIMVEHCKEIDGVVLFQQKQTNENICYEGEDVKVGELVLSKGTLIKPEHIAIFAAVGCTNPSVFKCPKVAIISTGDELVEPNQIPNKSQIRNSNGYQMLAQSIRAGAEAQYIGIAKDNAEHTFDTIKKAIDFADLIILSGGVSMGDFDFVPEILQKAGFKILFDSIAVQPGRPTTFAVSDDKICLGMPGNPVSSFIQFELMACPLIVKMMGGNDSVLNLKLPIASDFRRKKSERLAFVPARILSNSTVELIEYHGSAHIHALGNANALVAIQIGVQEIKKGDLVDVRLI